MRLKTVMRQTVHAGQGSDSKIVEMQTDSSRAGMVEIAGALRLLLADVFSVYIKTKTFQWHIASLEIFAMTDTIAGRVRKIGGSTLRSISDISRHQRLKDNNNEDVEPRQMLLEPQADNLQLIRFLRATHQVC